MVNFKKTMMASAGGGAANFVLYTQTDYSGTSDKYSQTNPVNIVSDGTYAYVQLMSEYYDGVSNNYLAMSVVQIDQSGNIGWSKDYYKGTNISANQYLSNYWLGPMELHNGYLYFSCFDKAYNRIYVKADASNGETSWSNTVYTPSIYSDNSFGSFVGPSNSGAIMLSSADFGTNNRDGEATLQEVSISSGLNNGWYGNSNNAMQGMSADGRPSIMKGAGHPNNNWFVCGITSYNGNQGNSVQFTAADFYASTPSGEYSSKSYKSAYPYGSSIYSWGGFKWINDTQFLSWGTHAREDHPTNNTAATIAPTLGLHSWNNSNHVSAFQRGASYDNVAAPTAIGYPVQDSDGDWHMTAKQANSNWIMKASQSGSAVSPVDCMRITCSGRDEYFSDAQTVAADDGGGVWVVLYGNNSNNGGQDAFIFRINSDWDVNQPSDVVTTDYAGTNYTWSFLNGYGGSSRYSTQLTQTVGWKDSTIEQFSANNNNSYLPVDDHDVQYDRFTGEENI